MVTLREAAQQALEALELLRTGLIQMREHAEQYGETWARAYVKEFRELLPGSAEDQFRALNHMHRKLADVADGVVNGYDAINALRQALEAEEVADCHQSEPCKACGGGSADLFVTRVCRDCGSEYSSQAEFDLAMRLRAEQQDEPFGYFRAEPFGWTDCDATDEGAVALYERPHQPSQQPLTDEQILRHITCSPLERAMFLRFARAIERAHHITGETK